MRQRLVRIIFLTLLAGLPTLLLVQEQAEARAGGGRTSGSRGSRSYSTPGSPAPAPSPYRSPAPTAPQAPQPSPGGGFLRSMAGGILGGMLGGMLFRSLGFAGTGMGGGGIGLFDILLIAGIGFFIYRFIMKRRQEAAAAQSPYAASGYAEPPPAYGNAAPAYAEPQDAALDAGLAHIRQMDAGFDPDRFCDQAMDIFFRIQGSWMQRDLTAVQGLLGEEMRRTFQADLDEMRRNGQINRLENVAVRETEIVEAWQEQGQDFLTVRIYANLLDYTVDEAGKVLAGSTSEPVKFEEYWTFSRQVGPNQWKLVGINQA